MAALFLAVILILFMNSCFSSAPGQTSSNVTDSVDIHVKNAQLFVNISKEASKDGIYSDKITTHKYDVMYGMLLYPIVRFAKHSDQIVKLLEIGLGCDMNYGPGRSAAMWQHLFGKNGEIWEADIDASCVSKAREKGQLDGIHTLIGHQGLLVTLYLSKNL